MALEAKVITFQTATAAGNQDVTGVGFPVKLAIPIHAQEATSPDGTSRAGMRIGFGVGTDEAEELSITNIEEDAQATTDASRRNSNAAFITLLTNPATIDSEASFVQSLADGFRLNWSPAPDAAYYITVLCLGGTGIEGIATGVFDPPAVTGNHVVSGVTDFEPDLMFFAASGGSSSPDFGINATASIGVATSPTERGVIAARARDGIATTSTGVGGNDERVVAILTGGSHTLDFALDLASFDATGFTVNVANAPGVGNRDVHWCAVKLASGVVAKVFSDLQRTSAGTTQRTGLGQPAKALLALSQGRTGMAAGVTSSTDDWNMNIGVAAGTDMASISSTSADNVSGSIAKRSHSTSKFLRFKDADTQNLLAECTVSLGSDGYTYDWTTADAVAREIIVLAFGEAAGGIVVSKTGGGSASAISGATKQALVSRTGGAAASNRSGGAAKPLVVKAGGAVSASRAGTPKTIIVSKAGGTVTTTLGGGSIDSGSVIDKAGGGRLISAAGGTRTVISIRTGGAVLAAVGLGTKSVLTPARAGGATLIASGRGAKQVFVAKSGGTVTAKFGGGTVDTTSVIDRGGGAALTSRAGGSRITVSVRTGGAVLVSRAGATRTVTIGRTGGGRRTSITGGSKKVQVVKLGGALGTWLAGGEGSATRVIDRAGGAVAPVRAGGASATYIALIRSGGGRTLLHAGGTSAKLSSKSGGASTPLSAGGAPGIETARTGGGVVSTGGGAGTNVIIVKTGGAIVGLAAGMQTGEKIGGARLSMHAGGTAVLARAFTDKTGGATAAFSTGGTRVASPTGTTGWRLVGSGQRGARLASTGRRGARLLPSST